MRSTSTCFAVQMGHLQKEVPHPPVKITFILLQSGILGLSSSFTALRGSPARLQVDKHAGVISHEQLLL